MRSSLYEPTSLSILPVPETVVPAASVFTVPIFAVRSAQRFTFFAPSARLSASTVASLSVRVPPDAPDTTITSPALPLSVTFFAATSVMPSPDALAAAPSSLT